MPLIDKLIRTPPELTDQQRIDHPFIAKVQDSILKNIKPQAKNAPVTDNNNLPAGNVDTLTTKPEAEFVKNAPVKPTDNNNLPAGNVDTLTTKLATTTIANPAAAKKVAGAPLSPAPAAAPAGAASSLLAEQGVNPFSPQDSALAQQSESAAAEAAAKEKQREVEAKIENINRELKEAMNTLTQKYNKASDEDKIAITIEMDTIRDKKFEELKEIQEQLDNGNVPAVVGFFVGIFNLIELRFKDFAEKLKLKPEVTEAQLDAVEALGDQIKKIKTEAETIGAPVDANNMLQLVNVLSTAAKLAAGPPIPKPVETSDGGSNNSIPSGMAGLDPTAAAALGGEEGAGGAGGAAEAATKAPGAAAAALGGEEGAGGAGGAAAAALGGEGGVSLLPNPGQDGGGISRKRSHPKYINEISENRNKIFKKELEIINSIRHFHRSHTIRKRDKINSILGLRKSRNNRNHGNTRRHRHEHPHKHRHNNHKHKSAKHIKK